MGKKDKKKGKGAEKTALKTEKKALNRIKKELASKGEDDIEKLIAEFQENDRKQAFIGEELSPPPSPRNGFTLCAHPEKDELLLFGGEYFNGSKTLMYNDLFTYNIKKDQWSLLKCPLKPPPRCSHQAVTLSQNGGEMWIFGGEFASPTHSNFYHYKDLWVFRISEKRWEQIKASGAPSPRSGHRMVAFRRQLIIFGGFHENIKDYKYYNDLHIFDLDNYKWSKVEPTGKVPTPRSSCQFIPLTDGRILLYGGYSKEKLKKDVDKGIIHSDMYYLHIDDKASPPKWKWVHAKPSGVLPSPRSGFSIALAPNNKAYAFGGVNDEDDEETLKSVFFNELYMLELDKGRWVEIKATRKDAKIGQKRKRNIKKDENIDGIEETIDDNEVANTIQNIDISDKQPEAEIETYNDSVFSVKIGPSTDSASKEVPASCSTSDKAEFSPSPRMNARMVIKHGILYLYGGIYEDGDRQVILSDFYSLDIHKMDEWHTIIPFSPEGSEWIESDKSESEDEESDDEEDEEEDQEADDENSDMET